MDTINIYKEWIKCEDYQFKVLVLASYLRDNSLAFEGTLDTMCQWLGIQNVTKNTKQIKEAIENLVEKEYLFCKKTGSRYLISITQEGLKDKRIVKVRKTWINTIKKYNIAKNGKVNRNWDTMLKGLIYIFSVIEEEAESGTGNGINTIITMKELGEAIGKCEATAGKIVNDLTQCDFEYRFTIEKTPLKEKYEEAGKTKYKGIGTYIKASYNWKE